MIILKNKIRIIALFALVIGFGWAFWRDYQNITRGSVNSWTTDVSGDCGVVLTGGANRVRTGLDLLSRQQIKKLIISGVHANVNLRELFPIWPFYGDLDEKNVVLERRSSTTYGNAQQSLPLVEALSCRDVVLVTSHLHMYRAMNTFQATYPETIPLVSYSVNASRSESGFWEISTEVLKAMFYRLWAY